MSTQETIMKIQTSAQSALATVRAELAALRSKHAQVAARAQSIKDEIRALHDAPIAPEDLPRYIRRFVDEMGKKWISNLRAEAAFDPRIRASGEALNTARWDDLETSGVGGFLQQAFGMAMRDGDALSALCFFLPDVVETKLSERLACARPGSWAAKAAPVAQREASIAELRVELSRVETEGQSLAGQIGEITAAMDC